MAKKHDIVALEITNTIWHLKDGHSSTKEWTLARVDSATRDGIVKSAELARYGYAQQLKHMAGNPKVYEIKGPNQAKAAKLFDDLSATNESPTWPSAEEIKAAILNS